MPAAGEPVTGCLQTARLRDEDLPGKVADMPDILGYARVSTDEQDLAGQILRLKAAGAAGTYEDVISGRTFDRPGLKALLD